MPPKKKMKRLVRREEVDAWQKFNRHQQARGRGPTDDNIETVKRYTGKKLNGMLGPAISGTTRK